MSHVQYITVLLNNWDVSKVTIGPTPYKDKKGAALLYDGKIPFLELTNEKHELLYTSIGGVVRNTEFNSKTKKFTDTWTGDWKLSLKLCNSNSERTENTIKLLSIFDDIETKLKKAKFDINGSPIKFGFDKVNNVYGIEESILNPEKPTYFNIKVRADMNDKTVPKATFINISKSIEEAIISNNIEEEIKGKMKCAPTFMLSIFSQNNKNVYIIASLRELMFSHLSNKDEKSSTIAKLNKYKMANIKNDIKIEGEVESFIDN